MLSTNKERALALLIRNGPTYRADLARQLNVSRTTVTNLAKDLVDTGLVESRSISGDSVLKDRLTLTSFAGIVGSLVFEEGSVALALGSLDGAVVARGSAELGVGLTGTERLDKGIAAMGQLIADHESGSGPLRAIHCAVNTQSDKVTGEILGGDASVDWRDSNPMTSMREAFGVPVMIENSARLEGLAEYLCGTGDFPANLIYVRLSRGVALGQVAAGRIQSGGRGGAGELGHVSINPQGPTCACGNRGCLMTYVALPALQGQIAAVLGEGANIEDLIASASAGSHPSRGLLMDAGTAVGLALTAVCNLLDPDVIVLGGGLSGAGDLIVDAVTREIKRRALPLVSQRLEVVVGQYWDDVDTVASAGLAQLRHSRELVESVVLQIADEGLAPTA